MANFSVEGNNTSKMHQATFAPPVGIAELFLVLNILLAITASLGNSLILVAIKNASSIHSATKLLFRCLAVTDLCVGLILQPLYVVGIIFRIKNMSVDILHYVYRVWGAMGMVLCGVSIMTSTVISVDRLLALLLGLKYIRYREVVTLKRVRVAVGCVWLIASSIGIFWVWRKDISRAEASVVFILCLVISIFCHTRIHLKLQVLIQNSVPHRQMNGEGTPLNIARYKKTVSSIMWVQLALVVCYVPWFVVAVLDANGIHHDIAWFVTITLVYVNSSLNPILYCWKIKEVNQAARDSISKLYCL